MSCTSRVMLFGFVAGIAGLLVQAVGISQDKKNEVEGKVVKITIGKETQNRGPELLKKITKVEYAILEINPPTLSVKAWGEVPTTGWKADLVRVVYVVPPTDGIQDYFLMGTRPTGGATVISEVSAKNDWKNFKNEASWIKGFRVHGSSEGVVEVRFTRK